MADKLSWTELRRALASRAGVTEKEANNFLTAFSGQLVEALKRDKQVKINGLGIFRLQAVAPRKSVNVTTGEEFTIEGYNKIVFAPEAGVKELIESNQPGQASVSEQPAAIDPLQKLGAQAEEIVDLLGDLGQSPKEEPKPAEPEPAPAEPEPQPAEPEPAPFVYTPQPFIPDEPKPEPEIIVQEPKRKKSHFFRDVLICLIILLLLLFGAYFFFRGQISGWIDKLTQFIPTTEQVEPVVVADTLAVVEEEEPTDPQQALIPEGALSQEQILAEFLEASGEGDNVRNAHGQELEYAGWITEEPMHEASRLAWMAKRYYGAKIYWPYLFDTNRDRVDDPNMIVVGTPIRVPKLTAAQRDTTNAQTIATIERLRRQAEQQMR